MSTTSSIEWTEQTWNPTVGCTKVSPGCKFCYAEVMARRLKAMGVDAYKNGFRLTLLPERLREPLLRSKPTTYFVNSMSDLFHEGVPDSFLRRVFEVIEQSPQHTFQILTKRAERLPIFFKTYRPPRNAWIGVSVEDKQYGLPRIDQLRAANVQTRFLSIEPLLEDLGKFNLRGIDWVIVGGESGPKARPMKREWVLNIKRQCDQREIPFFFKQWGAWGPDGKKRSKHANGRRLLGRLWDQLPDVPAEPVRTPVGAFAKP